MTSKTKTTPTPEEYVSDSFNWSRIPYKRLVKHIVNKFAPNLYYFCWVGYFQVLHKRIGLPFEGYYRMKGIFQTIIDLTNITIGGRRIDLFEPFTRGRGSLSHDLHLGDVKLSKEGIKVWKEAYKVGLWDDLCSIRREYCRDTEKFIKFCSEHVFFDHTAYCNRIKSVDTSTIASEKAIPKKSPKPLKAGSLINIEEISKKNIQKNQFRREYSSAKRIKFRKRKSTVYKKRGSYKSVIGTPYFSDRQILLFFVKRAKWATLQQIEQALMKDTAFIQEIARLDKSSQRFNRKRFSGVVRGRLEGFLYRDIIKTDQRILNGNIHTTQYLRLPQKARDLPSIYPPIILICSTIIVILTWKTYLRNINVIPHG